MRKYLFTALGLSGLLLTGCVDDSYDLSDIDTTTEIKVNNLVIPVNIDNVVLKDIISLDEDGKIKIMEMNGERFYAIDQKGDFNSDPITIQKVTAKAPTLNSITKTVYMSTPSGKVMRAPAGSVSYPLGVIDNSFSFSAGNVDKAIRRLDSAEIDNLEFSITITAQNISDKISEAVFENVELQLPKGLTISSISNGQYNAGTGVWTIPAVSSTNGQAGLKLVASAVDFAANGAVLDNETRRFTFSGSMNVNSGSVALVPKSGIDKTQLPSQFNIKVDYKLSDLTVNSVSGMIQYQIDGVDINPIWLTNIPEVFLGSGTNVYLTNPQIYLNLNNPVADNNLVYRTGLTLTAVRKAENNIPDISFSLNDPYFTVNATHGVVGPYNFVLSPFSTPLNIPSGFENCSHVAFTSLSNIVAVDPQYADRADFPEKLLVKLVNPEIPQQDVKNFQLGRSIAGVNGKYEFLAPLAFKDGSVIIYTDEKSDWNDKDVQALTIDHLTITATADSNLPVSAEMTIHPLNSKGQEIQSVTLKSTTLAANTAGQALKFELTGTIQDLDGLRFRAVIKSADAANPLRPDQTIVLKNVRATVNGKYVKEL